ncbi:sugar phosphate isomerase/epimerase family protein [Paenibacillus daejeonensis]|uniref:sugar phosphate isomerase/epimerase family protein n=1 Tax=Paenibacillus daejeonensis TaxID=135193 RepID=UPI0003617D91|nr:TIM barrel protein [Paenibacillus daejeonensis]
MRLAGPVFVPKSEMEPGRWIAALQDAGYRAAVCPVGNDADERTVAEYRNAAAAADIVIAEVGAWSNPISPDDEVRKQAIDHCIRQLELAERIGARCCVNIAGSRALKWDGPHADNFSDDTFALIVDTVRLIIDQVNPRHTFFTLETMPWIVPDSADSYLALVQAIDRASFAVHFDPVNMITSPRIYFQNGAMIRDFVRKLGPHIKNCHAKDIHLADQLTVQLTEVIPGTGALDYAVFLQELNQLDPDLPLILEHLSSESDYRQAAAHVRKTASELSIPL